MRKLLSVVTLIVIAACGGGTVNCTAADACTFNVSGNTVTGNALPVAAPGGSASSPTGAASSPSGAASSPATIIPLAAVHQLPPGITIALGDLRWSAGGLTYMLGVGSVGGTTWVAVYSTSGTSADGMVGTPLAGVEVTLDDGLDANIPANTDAAVKVYLQTIVPKLDTWMKANSGRWVNGITVYPVNTKNAPDGDALARVAARMAQWVVVSKSGATLQ